MRYWKYCLGMIVLAVIAACVVFSEERGQEQVPQEEPLLEPLLLLEEYDEGEDSLPLTESGADNGRCHVCHVNYLQEDIAVFHARADISCADCHGESDAHIADESWTWGENGTAPDIMYPLAEINPFCMSCHTKETIDTEEHEPLFADTDEENYCTDCHGDHRLPQRRCKWK